MNETVTIFLLEGDTFVPEMHLKQPGYIYSTCGPFTKSKESIEQFIQILFIEMSLIKLVFNI